VLQQKHLKDSKAQSCEPISALNGALYGVTAQTTSAANDVTGFRTKDVCQKICGIMQNDAVVESLHELAL